MPLYTGTSLTVQADAVREYAAQRGQDSLPEDMINNACCTVRRLAAPQGVFQQGFYDSASHHLLCHAPFQLKGTQIPPYLEQAAIILMGAVTLGPAIEQEIDRLFLQQDVPGGIVLDSAAAVAAGELLDQLTSYITEISEPKGYKIIWRFSPGNGDWPIGQQAELANAAGGSQIGLSLTAGGMLSPRKSLTALFGLTGSDGGCGGGCSGCALAGSCHNE